MRTANCFVVSVTYFDEEPKREFNLPKGRGPPCSVAISRLPELLEIEKNLLDFVGEPGDDDDLGE